MHYVHCTCPLTITIRFVDRMATRKSYQCLMEQSDLTEEQANCKAEFQSFWDNLEIQVQKARDFLGKETDEKTAMEELTNETLYPTKKEIEIELAEERKEEERRVQERKKEEAERKQKEAQRKKAEKKQTAKGGATGRRTTRCGTCQGVSIFTFIRPKYHTGFTVATKLQLLKYVISS